MKFDFSFYQNQFLFLWLTLTTSCIECDIIVKTYESTCNLTERRKISRAIDSSIRNPSDVLDNTSSHSPRVRNNIVVRDYVHDPEALGACTVTPRQDTAYRIYP